MKEVDVIVLTYTGINVCGTIKHAKIENAIFWKSILESKGFIVNEYYEKDYMLPHLYSNRGELLYSVLYRG